MNYSWTKNCIFIYEGEGGAQATFCPGAPMTLRPVLLSRSAVRPNLWKQWCLRGSEKPGLFVESDWFRGIKQLVTWNKLNKASTVNDTNLSLGKLTINREAYSNVVSLIHFEFENRDALWWVLNNRGHRVIRVTRSGERLPHAAQRVAITAAAASAVDAGVIKIRRRRSLQFSAAAAWRLCISANQGMNFLNFS